VRRHMRIMLVVLAALAVAMLLAEGPWGPI
jgi:hypothetical protein